MNAQPRRVEHLETDKGSVPVYTTAIIEQPWSTYRPEDHQCVRPVVIVRGKAPKDMKNPEDFWDVLEVVPGEPLMQKPDAFGCKLGDYT